MSDIPPPPPGQQPPPPPPPPGNMAPPPGYVAYGSGPTPARKISRIGGLATAVMIVVGIAGVGSVVAALSSIGQQSDAEDFLAGRLTDDEFNDKLISSSAFSALGGVAMLAGMILVMIWMYRIASNLRAFGKSTTWHPLFAIFGWFLPPGILYIIPMLMLREQWAKSAPDPGMHQGAQVSESTSENPVLYIWWATFGLWPLLALFLSAGTLIGNFGDTRTEAVAQNLVDTNQTLTVVGAVVSLVAAGAWIMFVKQLTARHRSMTGER